MGKKYGLSEELRSQIALDLYHAERDKKPIQNLTSRFPDIEQDDSYAIQKKGLDLRLADGALLVGRKIGITSKGMMELLNCDTPDYGYLLDDMILPEGTVLERSQLNIPILEGELAFVMGEDLRGPGVTTADIMNATSYVVPCFELCDTRFEKLVVTVKDTISDNAGACKLILGNQPKKISDINFKCIGMVIEKNGELMNTSTGAEVMGTPLNTMAWLANKLAEYDDGLRKGDVVLSGSFFRALPCEKGDTFTLTVDGFQSISLSFK